ncbi:hypothetical protein DL96DRAFT_204314 [Flagelloscypha sp. PMI_526]|nr:hypothetical protein DL96DRAFT_204314 [Flagelloscypha sp. PMI_526]
MEPNPSHQSQEDSSNRPGPHPQASVATGGGSLRGHSSTSSPSKVPWWCDECEEWLKTNRTRHMNSHFPPDKQALVYCPWGCGKSTLWGQKANLYPHIRLTHSNERLQCTLCHYKTHDNFAMSRHWSKDHKGKRRPKWPAPRMPSKSQVSSPAATNIPTVGSSSSSLSTLQLSPPLPVPSEYSSPPPPSSASSLASSLHSTPYSPTGSLPHEVDAFYPWVAECSISRVSDIASANLPVAAVSSEQFLPGTPPLSPLDSDLPLPDVDDLAPQGGYQRRDVKSHFRNQDLSMSTFPSSQLLGDHDPLLMSGLGHLPSNEFNNSDILNGYNSGSLDNFVNQNSYESGLDCSFFGEDLVLNNSLHNAPSPQNSLPSAMGSNSINQWPLPSNLPTFPTVDSFTEPALLSPRTSTASHPLDYGYSSGLDRRHPEEIDGTSSFRVAPSSFLNVEGPQFLSHYTHSAAGFHVPNDDDSSGSTSAYYDG